MAFFDGAFFDGPIFFDTGAVASVEPAGVYGGTRKKRLNPHLLGLIMQLLSLHQTEESLNTFTETELLQLWTLIKGSKRLPSDSLEDVDLLGLASGDFMVDSEEN